MLSYTIELTPRGSKKESTVWTGKAINAIDAIQLAKESVFPKLHIATIVKIGEESNGEQEGNAR